MASEPSGDATNGRRVARRVDVLALGGTIAMAPDSAGAGVSPKLSAADLVAAVPGLDQLADVHAQTVRTLPGASLTLPDLVDTVAAARACVADGSAGVVVTQGTDTLEETAFALDLLWDRPEPLVVTGAMRPASAAGADGPANLWAATAVAGSAAARERGVLVVFADEIHGARGVAKAHSTRPAAFASPGTGPVGWMAEATPRFVAPPAPRLDPLAPPNDEPPSVALVPTALGDDGRQLRAVLDAGFDAVVLAAMGGGHVPQRLVPVLEEAVARVPVAAASRTGAGALLRNTYAFRGSERDLHAMGLLDSEALAPLKARILLTLALWCADDRATAEQLFRAHAARA